MATAAINVQVDAKVKAEATKILSELGISMSTYINMALNQLVIQKRIPFELVAGERFNNDYLKTIKEIEQMMNDIKSGKIKLYTDDKQDE